MRIAYREWRVFWDADSKAPILYSTFIKCPWPTARFTSDKVPETQIEEADYSYGKLHGVHAMLPWAKNESYLSKPPPATTGPRVFVIGALDVEDRVVEHDDGIVRAENVRILALRLIDIPYPIPLCEHHDSGLVVVNRMMQQEDRFAKEKYRHCTIQRCTCFTVRIDSMTGKHPGPYDYHPDPLIVYESFTPEALQNLLLQRYEVPELPEGVGPWRPPWGWPLDSRYRQPPADNDEEFHRAR